MPATHRGNNQSDHSYLYLIPAYTIMAMPPHTMKTDHSYLYVISVYTAWVMPNTPWK